MIAILESTTVGVVASFQLSFVWFFRQRSNRLLFVFVAVIWPLLLRLLLRLVLGLRTKGLGTKDKGQRFKIIERGGGVREGGGG